jgi:hypothetical protein
VSTEVMQSGWTSLTARHVELAVGCTVLADALEVAAGYIAAQKAEAIAVLGGRGKRRRSVGNGQHLAQYVPHLV